MAKFGSLNGAGIVVQQEFIDSDPDLVECLLRPIARAAEYTYADPRASLDAIRVYVTFTYMPNKTISVPDDVIPIIESLDMPFSRWVTDQLRRYSARSTLSFAQQLLADAALAADERPDRQAARAVGERMGRSAPW